MTVAPSAASDNEAPEATTRPAAPPDEELERRLGRWTAIGLAIALTGALGGVLIELIFS